MCLRTSTFVVKPMLLISTHWLLWRCDPLDLCSDRPSETQKATFLRAGASSFPLILMFMSTGQKLGFSLVRTGGGRSRFWRRNFAARADSRYRCTGVAAMCDSPGRGQLRALVKHQQRHSGVPSVVVCCEMEVSSTSLLFVCSSDDLLRSVGLLGRPTSTRRTGIPPR